MRYKEITGGKITCHNIAHQYYDDSISIVINVKRYKTQIVRDTFPFKGVFVKEYDTPSQENIYSVYVIFDATVYEVLFFKEEFGNNDFMNKAIGHLTDYIEGDKKIPFDTVIGMIFL